MREKGKPRKKDKAYGRERDKELGQSGGICGRNAVVETRSVSVTSRRLRCRLAPTGCYRQPRSSQPAEYPLQFSLKRDYACPLLPLHIVFPCFITCHFFLLLSCPQRRVSFHSSSFPLFWPSHASFATTLLLPPVSHPLYKFALLPTPFSIPTVITPLRFSLSFLTPLNGVSPRSRVLK